MSAPIDLVELKRTQREQWSLSAVAWNRWWSVFEAGARVVSDTLCDMAQLKPGQRVLDIACGLGEPAFTAARRVGPSGRVLGVDLATQMIAFAAGRARADAQLSNVRFLESDGENLALRDASFDAAVSRWGLMLMPEPPRAAHSIRRTLKPGARFAAAVWSTPDEVPFIAVPQAIAERELGIPPPNADTPGPMRMGRAGQLEECLRSAGFGQIESRIVPLTMTFASPAQYIQFQREMSGTLKRALESQPADVQARTWALVERALAPFVAKDGRLVFENRCRLAVGIA